MSDVNTETEASKTFNAEAFAMNIARAMEIERPGARGLSQAARDRRGDGQAAQRNRRSHQDLLSGRRILALRQGARCGPADQNGQGLSRSLGFGGAPHGRRTDDARDRAVAARQALQGPRVEIEPVLRFRAAALSAHHAVGRGAGEERRRPRSAHAQEGRVLRSADLQRDRAVEFRSSPIRKCCARRWPRTATTSCAA